MCALIKAALSLSVVHGRFPVFPFPVHSGELLVQNPPAFSHCEAGFPPDFSVCSLFHQGRSAFCATSKCRLTIPVTSFLIPRKRSPPMKKISRRTPPPNIPPEKPAANHSLKSEPESMLTVKKQTARGMLALVQAYHGQGIFTRIFHRQILRSIHHFSGLLAILPPFLG